MKKSWVDSGRVETVVALAVLVAVIALFAKFYRPATPEPQLPMVESRTPATTGPTSSAPGS
ncbi:MAG: hypothetical protein M9894_38575 [Planctomycetes bacterium]|nr:hypothetical protein [Planctomycetota bacterium]